MTQAQQPILVPGATGNVGAAVVHTLLTAGLPVRAAAGTTDSVRKRFGEAVEAVTLDFTNRDLAWRGRRGAADVPAPPATTGKAEDTNARTALDTEHLPTQLRLTVGRRAHQKRHEI